MDNSGDTELASIDEDSDASTPVASDADRTLTPPSFDEKLDEEGSVFSSVFSTSTAGIPKKEWVRELASLGTTAIKGSRNEIQNTEDRYQEQVMSTDVISVSNPNVSFLHSYNFQDHLDDSLEKSQEILKPQSGRSMPDLTTVVASSKKLRSHKSRPSKSWHGRESRTKEATRAELRVTITHIHSPRSVGRALAYSSRVPMFESRWSQQRFVQDYY